MTEVVASEFKIPGSDAIRSESELPGDIFVASLTVLGCSQEGFLKIRIGFYHRQLYSSVFKGTAWHPQLFKLALSLLLQILVQEPYIPAPHPLPGAKRKQAPGSPAQCDASHWCSI